MTIYRDYQAARDAQQQAYAKLKQVNGRLSVGPSKDGGVYIATDNTPASTIPNISEDEARFIIRALSKIYGFDEEGEPPT